MGLTTRLAALWGFLEATIFFIVPDVLLTYLATQKQRTVRPAIIAATLGALVGGSIMFLNGMHNHHGTTELLALLPATDKPMITQVNSLLIDHGYWGVFLGPLFGLPYKLFAIEAAALSFNPWIFLLISIPARCLRFVLITMLVRILINRCFQQRPQKQLNGIWLISWLLFYTAYFHHFGW